MRVAHLGDLEVDFAARRVLLGGRPVDLTKSEFRLLAVLAGSPDEAVADRDLLSAMWGKPWPGDTTALQVHVSRLRRKLGESGKQPRYIRTVPGFGYRLDPDPHPPGPAVSPPDLPALPDAVNGDQPAVYAVIDVHRAVQWVSDSVTGLLGWAPEDLIGVAVSDLGRPQDRQRWLADGADLNVGRPLQTILPVRAADGSYRSVQGRVRPLLGADGGVSGFLAEWRAADPGVDPPEPGRVAPISLDVGTDTSLLGLLADSSDLLLVTDADGLIVWVSASVRALLGCPPEHLVETRRATELLHPEEVEPARAALREAIAGGVERARGRTRVVAVDGTVRWVDWAVTLQWRDGRVVRYLASLRDVDAEVRAQQELAVSEERYRLLAENAADVVLRLDGRDRTVWVSASLLRVTGWAPEDVLGDTRWDLIHPDDRPLVTDAVTSLRSGKAVTQTVQVRVRHRHGPCVWFSVAVQRTGDDPDSDVVVALRDVDDRVRRDEAARRSERRRAAALAVMLDPLALLEPVRDPSGVPVDFRYVEANPAAAQYFDLTRESLVGSLMTDSMAADTAATLIAAYARVLDGAGPLVLDGMPLTSQVAEGATRWFDVRAVAVEGLVEVVWRNVTERVEAAAALADSQARYRLLAENATDVVVRVGADGTVTWVSPAIRTCLGWTPDDLFGTALIDLVHPQDADLVRDARARLLAGEQARPPESGLVCRLRTRQGDFRWLSAHGAPVVDAHGRPDGVVYGLSLVDDLVQARERAQDSEQRVRLLLDTMAEGVIVYGPDGRVVEANPAAQRIVGMTAEQLAGRVVASPLFRTVRADGSPMPDAENPVAVCLATGTAVRDAVVGMYRPDGVLVWIQSTVEPLPDPDGTPAGVVATFADITDRVIAEQGLRDSEQRYRLLAERSTDVVFRASPGAVLEWISPSAGTVLGRDPDSMVGRGIAAFMHPDDLPAMQAASRAADIGQTVPYRARVRHADGSWRWVDVAAQPVVDDHGTVTARIGAARDVTAQVQAEQALAASEEVYRTALQSASVGMCLVAPGGTFLRVNPALCDLLDRDEATLTAATWQELTHPEDLAEDLGLVDDVLQGRRESYRLRKRFLRPDGSIVHGDLSVGCVREADGSVRHFVSQIVDVTVEERQREALSTERARLRATLDAELDPHVTLTAVRDDTGRVEDFVYTDANPAGLAYLEVTAEQLLGARMIHAFPETVTTGLRDLLAAALDTRTAVEVDGYVYPDLFGDGVDRVFDLRGALVGDAVSLTWRDVTDRHAAAAALAESQERFRLLAENASDMVALTDEDGVVRWFSPSVAALGYTPEELVGRPAADYLHPDDWPILVDARQATARGESATVEWRVRAKDGRYRWFRVRIHPVTDPDGAVTGRVSGWQDIDTERAIRTALEESEEQYRLLAETTSDLVEQYDPTWHVVWASPSVEGMLGYTPDEVVGRYAPDLIHPDDDTDTGRDTVATVLDGRGDGHRRRVRRLRADGSYLWVDSSMSFRYADDGTLLATYVTSRDIDAQVAAEQRLIESQQRFSAMFADHDAIMLLIEPETGAIVDANKAAAAFYGYDTDTLRSMQITDLSTLPPEEVREKRLAAVRGEWNSFVFPHRLADGTVRQVQVHSSPIDDGERVLLFSIIRDITDDLAARQALAASEERFRTAMLSAPAGMAVVSLDRVFTEVNPALCRILGRPSAWLVGRRVVDVLDDPDADTDRSMRAHALAGPEDSVTREHQMIRSDGERVWVEHSIGLLRDADGRPVSFVSQFVDVTEARQARERLRFLASHDALTELLNRRELITRIEDLLARKPRLGQGIAVLFIDLDGLKPINDTHGHAAGDTVIATVAARLRHTVRADDLVARIGGDEFVVVLTTIGTVDDAARVAAAIHDQAAVPVHTDHDDIPVTVSIGLALAEPGDAPDTALRRADTALYQAKQRGRNRTVIHHRDMPGTVSPGA